MQTIKLPKIPENRFAPVWIIIILFLLISFATRFILLLYAGSHSGISMVQGISLFFIGLLYDISVAAFIILPLAVFLWFQNNFIYRKKNIVWITGGFLLLLGLLIFTNIIPKDYNRDVHKALVILIAIRLFIYLLLTVLPYRFRVGWRRLMLYFFFTSIIFLLLFNAVSEFFFWQEFSVRYNFIAVDYLVYTNEVVGNIIESYPIYKILIAVAVTSIGICFFFGRMLGRSVILPMRFTTRSAIIVLLFLLAGGSYFFIPGKWRHFSKNEYANELAGNGLYQFAVAYNQNELDFYKFYQTLPDEEAFAIVRRELQSPNATYTSTDHYSIERNIRDSLPERRMNIVLISVESLSADFMQAFGNQQHLTPHLDSLAKQSLFFTNFYASGTRTVRGLEAITLSIPPTPGQSTVKRPNNEGLFSLGSVLKEKGYTTQYIYGGYSYFDNMQTFFSHNGYDVIDRSAISPADIHYENIWGVADEDLFTLSLHTLDKNAALKKPFFTHIMTVSNHRPFTYPDGRIDIPAASQSREGGVKYTDYAIHQFLTAASHKSWFDSTMFIIVADHCAGSAGIAALPVTGYHIPLLIYAPKLIRPQIFTGLCTQVDIAPICLGLLHFNYRSKFFGQDVLNTPAEKRRAFISTYQGLGYLQNGRLIIQSPVKKIEEFVPDFATGNAIAATTTDSLKKKAISFYQCASWLLDHKKYRY